LVEQCQALERRTFPQTEALQLRNELRKPNTYLVVAFEKPQPLVVGYALFSLIKCEATARLTKLAVKKSHRNRGIGSRVVQYVLAQVTRLPTPIARAMLHVDPSRREAHRLYRRLGFHTVTTLSDYYGAGR
ncbi:acyl-CoA N-acyltransferase, partial [Dimargaris cristalligena]